MNKPNNFDNTPDGSFVPVDLGGHIIVIKRVKEITNKHGKPMIVIAFDFAQNDSQPAYFSKAFEADIRPDKKWPYAGTKWINVQAWDSDDCSKDFKSFITSFEKSNGCIAKWGDDFISQFSNKLIGGVFGEVEDEYNGKTTVKRELRWFCEVDKAKDAKVPELKPLKGKKKEEATAPAPEGFIAIPDESIPF